jgi:putative FmdB family regulatory protein
MPIYEYRCNQCRQRTSVFVRSFSSSVEAVCASCGSEDLFRLISSFSIVRSEESRLDDLADPSNFGGIDENDPQSMARWARRFGSEMGEDLGPEFDEMVDRMEAGEMPDDLDDGGGDGGFDGALDEFDE